jgi:hypothetical protein
MGAGVAIVGTKSRWKRVFCPLFTACSWGVSFVRGVGREWCRKSQEQERRQKRYWGTAGRRREGCVGGERPGGSHIARST